MCREIIASLRVEHDLRRFYEITLLVYVDYEAWKDPASHVRIADLRKNAKVNPIELCDADRIA